MITLNVSGSTVRENSGSNSSLETALYLTTHDCSVAQGAVIRLISSVNIYWKVSWSSELPPRRSTSGVRPIKITDIHSTYSHVKLSVQLGAPPPPRVPMWLSTINLKKLRTQRRRKNKAVRAVWGFDSKIYEVYNKLLKKSSKINIFESLTKEESAPGPEIPFADTVRINCTYRCYV